MKKILLGLAFLLAGLSTQAYNEPDSTDVQIDEEALLAAYQAYLDSVQASLDFVESGVVEIGDGLASVAVPAGFKFLNGDDGEMVLVDLWGNPPSAPGERSLGMLFPAEGGPADLEGYAINITFVEEGYIDDSDAKDIDYDELLETMQSDFSDSNDERVQMGYDPIELVGWASEPFYDSGQKKLHWALELQFGEDELHTLNYHIRILGRRGYLNCNVIGDMNSLPEVQRQIGTILPSISFNDGHRYADFDSKLDEVAAYGIGGLIAGKMLAKAGLLATLGVMLAKFWKIIALAVVGLLAGLRKFLGGKAAREGEAS